MYYTNFLLIMALSVIVSCSSLNDEPKQMIIRGIATDAITNEPFDSLFIKVVNERCFLSDLGYCEPVEKTVFTEKNGYYYISALQNCETELQIRFMSNDPRKYKNGTFNWTEQNDKIDELSCNDKPLLFADTKYHLNIQVHPKIDLIITKKAFGDLRFKRLYIKDFDIEITQFEYTYRSLSLELKQYQGIIEIEVEYENSSMERLEIPYDYFESQQVDVVIKG